jgi:hypothetical protein
MYIKQNENSIKEKMSQELRGDLEKPKLPDLEREPKKQHITTIMRWDAPEFEMLEKNKKRLAYMLLLLSIIIGYAAFTNSPLMALVFILIGIVAYLDMQKTPRNLNFSIIPEGIIAGKELYDFDNIRSFWIFYDPEYKKIVCLHTKSFISPFVHIPIHDQDPVAIRNILIKHIPEKKQDHNFTELLERLIGI